QRHVELQRDRERDLQREADLEHSSPSRRGPTRDGAITPVGEPMRISSRPVESNGRGSLGPPHPVSPTGAPGAAAGAGVALGPGSWGPAAVAESPIVPGGPPPSGPGDGSGDGPGSGSGDGPGDPGPDGPRGPSTERATVILAAGTFASRLTGFL